MWRMASQLASTAGIGHWFEIGAFACTHEAGFFDKGFKGSEK